MTDQIPIIDLQAFPRGDRATRVRVAKQLGSAAETFGFVVVSGHGIDPAIGNVLKEAAVRFFDLPRVTKMIIRRPTNDQNRGYIPYGEETLVRMAGGDSPPDYKEVFAIVLTMFPKSCILLELEVTQALLQICGLMLRQIYDLRCLPIGDRWKN